MAPEDGTVTTPWAGPQARAGLLLPRGEREQSRVGFPRFPWVLLGHIPRDRRDMLSVLVGSCWWWGSSSPALWWLRVQPEQIFAFSNAAVAIAVLMKSEHTLHRT